MASSVPLKAASWDSMDAVGGERAGEQACAAGAGSVLLDGFDGGLVDARVSDEAEVVVGGHHQHRVSVGDDVWPGLGLERHVVGVGVDRAGERGVFEEPAGAGVEEVGFSEGPGLTGGEVLSEHLSVGGREGLRGLRGFLSQDLRLGHL